jgi:4'-phosphopantetheinyl transferase EntD
MSVGAALEVRLRGLLPPGAVASVAGAADPSPDWAARFPEEAGRMRGAAASRRAEYFTGRQCARRCLGALGGFAVSIPSDDTGLPIWPEGVAGSIAHSRGTCLAVAASAGRVAAIGVDLERTGRMSAAAAERILHPQERAFAGDDRDRATLLFSLKEAFFKCQFPVFGAHPGFREVAFSVDEEGPGARVVWSAAGLPAELRQAAGGMEFRFVFCGDVYVSIAWIEAE